MQSIAPTIIEEPEIPDPKLEDYPSTLFFEENFDDLNDWIIDTGIGPGGYYNNIIPEQGVDDSFLRIDNRIQFQNGKLYLKSYYQPYWKKKTDTDYPVRYDLIWPGYKCKIRRNLADLPNADYYMIELNLTSFTNYRNDTKSSGNGSGYSAYGSSGGTKISLKINNTLFEFFQNDSEGCEYPSCCVNSSLLTLIVPSKSSSKVMGFVNGKFYDPCINKLVSSDDDYIEFDLVPHTSYSVNASSGGYETNYERHARMVIDHLRISIVNE